MIPPSILLRSFYFEMSIPVSCFSQMKKVLFVPKMGIKKWAYHKMPIHFSFYNKFEIVFLYYHIIAQYYNKA